MTIITDKDEVYQIYLKNLEYINKNIKRKNKHYGTKFEEKWLIYGFATVN